ncbi:protein-tyrosine phosphatase-like protein [Aspergillus aurantiobrunneus]
MLVDGPMGAINGLTQGVLVVISGSSAHATVLLQHHRISHVLSVHTWGETHHIRFTIPNTTPRTETGPEIQRYQEDIDDDPTEDILRCISHMLDWVRSALVKPHPHPHRGTNVNGVGTVAESQALKSHAGGRVLVHCNHGISRSGAVVVAYIMRALSLPYVNALACARESHAAINPNIGFEYQLRIWEGCGYEVFERVMRNSSVILARKGGYKAWVEEVESVYDRENDSDVFRAKDDWLRSVQARLEILRVV